MLVEVSIVNNSRTEFDLVSRNYIVHVSRDLESWALSALIDLVVQIRGEGGEFFWLCCGGWIQKSARQERRSQDE
jgi:hypothetical protein